MTKILHCITDLSPDGAQRTLLRTVIGLEALGFQNRVVSLVPPTGPLLEQFQSSGVEVRHTGMRAKIPGPRTVRSLVHEIGDFRPDVLQGWMYHANVAAYIASRLTPTRVAVSWNIRRALYETQRDKLLTRAVIRFGALASKQVESIVYCVEVAADQHEQLGFSPARRVVIPNGFDTQRFAPSKAARQELKGELGLGPSSFLVGIVGRYHHQKDYPTFLRAAHHVLHHIPNTHFLMVGRGVSPTNRDLQSLISELQLSGHVHMLGERNDIPRILASLDLFVSSSENEGFSNVIGEAMASGTPCVATDAGASKELLNGLGCVVPRRSPEPLGEAIIKTLRLSRTTREELRRAFRERIVSHYSLQTMIDRYAELYSGLTRGSPLAPSLRHAA